MARRVDKLAWTEGLGTRGRYRGQVGVLVSITSRGVRLDGVQDPPDIIDISDGVIRLPEDVDSEARGNISGRYKAIGLWLVGIDTTILVLALTLAYVLRFGAIPPRDYGLGLIMAGAMWVGVFYASGLYAPHHLSAYEEFRRTVGAVAIGIVFVILLTFWLDVYLSRSWMAITLIIALPLEVLARNLVRGLVKRLQRNGTLAYNTLVLGTDGETRELMNVLRLPGSGFLPIGQIDIASSHFAPGFTAAQRVDRLLSIVKAYDPDCLFVASSGIDGQQLVTIMQVARRCNAEVRLYTHLSEVLMSRVSVQPVMNGGTALTVRPLRLTRTQSFIKRSFDCIAATILLVLTAPVLLAVAAAIRLTSPGPALFTQERVTEGGRSFLMYKFRTMTADVDRLPEDQTIDTSRPFFKMKEDPRLTKVGRLLRKTSVDELPQLLNVIRGDMSLVGPRPLPADQVTANLELLGPRHEVRAGVTGWWQIKGRSDVGPDEALKMDLFYIENWSPALDLYILLRTVGVLVARKGAY
jgi:exopolysaccharide biosynthesis polyprenyl glycosylphosphotransferase